VVIGIMALLDLLTDGLRSISGILISTIGEERYSSIYKNTGLWR
jgi:hypothetical protein